ncbi:hypothetical protein C3B79_3268 [Aeromonas hydrophila]|nr:hypothetical protein C3B79_3268 [Aeromonas hydrophila]
MPAGHPVKIASQFNRPVCYPAQCMPFIILHTPHRKNR